MRKKSTLVLITLALFVISSFGLSNRWAQAWVENRDISETEYEKLSLLSSGKNSLSLILLEKKSIDSINYFHKNFLRCYLINNSETQILIDRSDATIASFFSEVKIGDKWLTFQEPVYSMCGNSYWKQKLDSKKGLIINYDNVEGKFEVSFRTKIIREHDTIYSNQIITKISSEEYQELSRK